MIGLFIVCLLNIILDTYDDHYYSQHTA